MALLDGRPTVSRPVLRFDRRGARPPHTEVGPLVVSCRRSAGEGSKEWESRSTPAGEPGPAGRRHQTAATRDPIGLEPIAEPD